MKVPSRCALLLAAACLAGGCALLPAGQAEPVRLPELPEAWRLRFPGLTSVLVWPGPDGSVERLRIGGWPREALVELPRAAPTPVLAVPIHAGVELLPAGGLYPPDGSRFELSWAEGPVAACLLRLAAAGYDLRELNTARLIDEVAALGLEDPWHLDTGRLAACILGGRFRVTDLRAAERREVALALAPGVWLPASAAGPGLVSDGNLLFLVPDGFHRFFHAGLPLRADLFVTGAEVTARVSPHPF